MPRKRKEPKPVETVEPGEFDELLHILRDQPAFVDVSGMAKHVDALSAQRSDPGEDSPTQATGQPVTAEAIETARSQVGESDGLVTRDTSSEPNGSDVRACAGGEDEEPESLEDRIARLPMKWLRSYIRALFACGGIDTQARKAIRGSCGGVSYESVDKAAANNPEFAALIQEARREGHGMVDGAVLNGAVHGDEQPIYQQGEYVGSKRIRNPKDAELYYRRHGLLAEQQVSVNHSGRVEMAQDSDLPRILAEIAVKLFGSAKPAKVVSISDKEG